MTQVTLRPCVPVQCAAQFEYRLFVAVTDLRFRSPSLTTSCFRLRIFDRPWATRNSWLILAYVSTSETCDIAHRFSEPSTLIKLHLNDADAGARQEMPARAGDTRAGRRGHCIGPMCFGGHDNSPRREGGLQIRKTDFTGRLIVDLFAAPNCAEAYTDWCAVRVMNGTANQDAPPATTRL